MQNSDLETGLAALKDDDYATAIAILERVCERELHQPTVYRAQIALVKAYQKNRAPDQAIALCQTLTRSSNPKIKQWAIDRLGKLQKHSPAPRSQPADFSLSQDAANVNPPSGERTGFIPLEDSPGETATPPPIGDRTGFIPLEDNSPREKSTPSHPPLPPPLPGKGKPPNGDRSGFTPLNPPAKPSRKPRSQPPSPPPMPPKPPASPAKSRKTPPSPVADKNQSRKPDPPQTETPIAPKRQLTWRQAERAEKWRPLKVVKPRQLFFTQIATAIGLFWMLHLLLHWGMALANEILYRLPLLWPIQAFYRDQTWVLLGGLAVFFAASPWLLDAILRQFYGMKSLSLKALGEFSPEARRLLPRYCFDRKLPTVQLGILPTSAPIAFTYGCLPRFARIALSEGLLQELEDDEIAAIYAGELGHIQSWDFPLMSLAVLLCQIPYLIYWQVAREADKLLEEQKTVLRTLTLGMAGVISAVAYGFYRLLRWPVLWLSRQRLYYSDRVAASLTGNPNGLTRGLLKMAIAMVKDIEKQGQTSFAMEGFDLLMPISPAQGIALGSCGAIAGWETLLQWDRRNPHEKWLSVNNSHPPLGRRLTLLDLYARFWKLDSELDLANSSDIGSSASGKGKVKRLFLQGAPYFGLPLGLLLGGAIWILGAILSQLGMGALDWVWGDEAILQGSVAIGISLGIFIRINHFFPDVTRKNLQVNPDLAEAIADANALPVDSPPISVEGTLVGRPGVSNWLGQDLMVRSPTGLLKLHCFSQLGPLLYLWPDAHGPKDWLGQSVTVTGWFRRGTTVWLDVEVLKNAEGKSRYCYHPIWSTILAALGVLLGVYLISRGGL